MKRELRFDYIFGDGYRPVFVNGAHGGVSPRGELVINFYHERPPLPDSVTHELSPDGTIGREVQPDPASAATTMVRSVDAGIIMSYENARNFHLWLGERLREMEALEKARAAFAADRQKAGGGTTH
jgi:hypothetical protein